MTRASRSDLRLKLIECMHSFVISRRAPTRMDIRDDRTWAFALRRSIGIYFALILIVSLTRFKAFTGRFGRRHRVCGLCHLVLLCELARDPTAGSHLTRDISLFVSAITVTLTAHGDFAEAHAKAEERNAASGTLHRTAAVSASEMLEHAFYQMVNAFQILYLHVIQSGWFDALGAREKGVCALGATSIWLVRGQFPVNSFSKNYDYRSNPRVKLDVESVLYRIKKYQYVLYKTVLLHGLNASLAFADATTRSLVGTPHFRCFWIALNGAYVFEFFLQTLVKRKYLSQNAMLALNQTLMVISTMAVFPVLTSIDPVVAATTFALNFINRKREMQNVFIALVVAAKRRGVI